MIITHCDKEMPNDEFINGKISAFKKYGQVDVDRDNVILFDNTKESL